MNDQQPPYIDLYHSTTVRTIFLFAVFGLFFTIFPVNCNFGPPASSGNYSRNDARPEADSVVRPLAQGDQGPDIARVRMLPKSSEGPLWIAHGSEPVKLELRRGVWSREIVTPEHRTLERDYQTIVRPNPECFYIWFKDNTIVRISQSDKEFKEYGMRRGIFRILVEEEGQNLTVIVP